MRVVHFFTSILAFLLAALAFAFIVTSATSRDWAYQHHYNSTLDQKDWSTPLYRTFRSPFVICKLASTASSANATTGPKTYPLNCVRYRPFGFGKTSCESVNATQSYRDARTGDERLCQQIHHAGNLSIASSVFIGIAFLLTAGMAATAILPRSASSTPQGGENPVTTLETSEEPKSDSAKPSPGASSSRSIPKSTYAYINLILILSFAVGGLCALLAQFYGILAFIMSQPDQGAFALARGNSPNPTLDNSHGPWIQGKALNAYLTLAWVCSALTAGVAGAAWRLPRGRHPS